MAVFELAGVSLTEFVCSVWPVGDVFVVWFESAMRRHRLPGALIVGQFVVAGSGRQCARLGIHCKLLMGLVLFLLQWFVPGNAVRGFVRSAFGGKRRVFVIEFVCLGNAKADLILWVSHGMFSAPCGGEWVFCVGIEIVSFGFFGFRMAV